MYHLSILPDLM